MWQIIKEILEDLNLHKDCLKFFETCLKDTIKE